MSGSTVLLSLLSIFVNRINPCVRMHVPSTIRNAPDKGVVFLQTEI
jgi:hypothetical protein